ncbi:MAG: enoyl-CoA hydratase/isomerase family protein [Proteobacteria bacterium]|nr:enoyl-CoA hydratase/isomerase family protein [Pseudomonadota bacterium]
MTETVQITIDEDGIATLAIDVPGQSMNVINQAFQQEFADFIAQVAGDDAIKGAIITSAKPTFMAGADLRMLGQLTAGDGPSDAAAVFEACFSLNKVFREMETCGKPFVAAINGLAMGGGFEMMLACHHRIVADDPKIKLGLPEVMVGLLPGAGGTQRLPRLAGVQVALQYASTGKTMSPQEAMGMNIVQEVVPGDKLLEAAKAWLMDKPTAVQPWDKKGFKFPGGGGAMHPGAVMVFMGASAMAQDKTKHNYPAVEAILSCVYEGSILPMDKAIRVESKYFAKLIMGDVAPNMIRTLFVNKTAAEKGAKRPAGPAPHEVKKLGMLGAGMMGAGIAYVSARAGMEVVLLDRDTESAEKGKAYAEALVEKGVKRRKISKEKGEALLDRIHPTSDFADLEGCDLVIEAVFEDREIKAETTKKTEAVIPADTVFASNTSTLPITGLAEAFSRPEDFIGIHFFSPVDRMPLVEIIMGEKTGDKALAHALDYVRQIRKTPIVVNDSRGFYTSRCFGTYVMEGVTMLAEGINPALIENAGKICGMPVGPLAVGDEVSIELSYKVMMATKKDMGDKYPAGPGDDVVIKFVEELGRLGKKSGKGFYEYPEKGKKFLWPGLAEHYPLADDQPTLDEVKTRFLYRQAIEAARCFEEGVLNDPESGDIGAIFGWGFAPYTGGPLSMIDTIGAEAFVREADRLAQAYGERFAVPQSLRDMASGGGTFYGGAEKKAAE